MSVFLRLHDIRLDVHNFNDDFLLLRSEETAVLRKIGKAIYQRAFDFVDEVIVTEVEICLKLNARFRSFKIGQLMAVDIEHYGAPQSYRLPICFSDHEDWKLIETFTSRSRNGIIEKLVSSDYSIAMFGFLPGFMYLAGLDPSLQVPRKTLPSKYVKANSVAIGGKYLGLYALDSPGGWNVIGQTPFSMLQLPKLPPVAANLGDTIHLHPIDKDEFDHIVRNKTSLATYNA